MFKVSIADTLRFTLVVEFPECDVDMALVETPHNPAAPWAAASFLASGATIPLNKAKLPQTPITATVDFAIEWLAGYVDREEMCTLNGKYWVNGAYHQTELEALGVTVVEWGKFIQGQAYLTCEVEVEKFTPELVVNCNAAVEKVVNNFVKYHA